MDAISLYEEMSTKFGFGDGENVPLYALECRKVMVEAINQALGEDSDVEAYAYDRPGCHNWCLLLFRKKGAPEIRDRYYGEVDPPRNLYEILAAINDSELLYSAVQVKVALSSDYKKQVSRWAEEFRRKEEAHVPLPPPVPGYAGR